VVTHLARKLLHQDPLHRTAAGYYEKVLYDQTRPWLRLRRALEKDLHLPVSRWLLQGLTGTHQDLEGRGGTAVWRAERIVETFSSGSIPIATRKTTISAGSESLFTGPTGCA
jgi:hypothetical protein